MSSNNWIEATGSLRDSLGTSTERTYRSASRTLGIDGTPTHCIPDWGASTAPRSTTSGPGGDIGGQEHRPTEAAASTTGRIHVASSRRASTPPWSTASLKPESGSTLTREHSRFWRARSERRAFSDPKREPSAYQRLAGTGGAMAAAFGFDTGMMILNFPLRCSIDIV